MSRRLNGWQRIGITLSILWAITFGFYERSLDLDSAWRSHSYIYGACINRQAGGKDLDSSICLKEADESYSKSLEGSWDKIAFESIVPIPFAWLLVYVLIRRWRWVKRGFDYS